MLPEIHYDESAKRQIEGTRLARMVPKPRGLNHEQLFMQYFNAFLNLKEFKESYAPSWVEKLGLIAELGLEGYFPNLVSRQFGLTQLLPKSIYLDEKDICLGYYDMIEPQYHSFLQDAEKKKYNISPFEYTNSHFCTREFSK
ncbi:hypothetical protein A2U01_0029306, partial [Trifolium medium]|nr:hypothetical protein [Trifolium medium]